MLHSLYLLTLTEIIYVYGVLDLPDSLPDSTKVSGVVGKFHIRRENLVSGDHRTEPCAGRMHNRLNQPWQTFNKAAFLAAVDGPSSHQGLWRPGLSPTY